MKKLILNTLCCFIFLIVNSQNYLNDSVVVSGIILNDASTIVKSSVRLSTFNPDDPPIFLNVNTNLSFTGKIKVTTPTLYKLTYSGYYVLFIATPNEKEIKFKIEDKTGFKSLNIIESKENDTYYTFRDQIFQFIDSMKYISETHKTNLDESIKKANQLIEKHNSLFKNLITLKGETYTAKVLLPSFLMNKLSEKIPLKTQLANQFFKNVNFADSSLFVIKDLNLIFSDYFDFFADSSISGTKLLFPSIFENTHNNRQNQKELGFMFIDLLTAGKREFYLRHFVDYLQEQKEILNNIPVLNERIKLLSNTLPGKVFFDLTATDPNNLPISLSDLVSKNKLTMLIFWEPDCQHCQKEIPKYLSLYQKFKDQKFEVLAVSIGNDKDKWKKYIDANNLNWKNAINPSDPSIFIKYYLQSTPISVLIDNNGIIKSRFTKTEELEFRIESLLKKK